MVVAVSWQETGSSSAKSFRYVFPDSCLSSLSFAEIVHILTIEYNMKTSVHLLFAATHQIILSWQQQNVTVLGSKPTQKTVVARCMLDDFWQRSKASTFRP